MEALNGRVALSRGINIKFEGKVLTVGFILDDLMKILYLPAKHIYDTRDIPIRNCGNKLIIR